MKRIELIESMKKMKGAIGIAAIVGVVSSFSFAARPFSVEDSGVLEKGFELELGYSGNTNGEVKEYEKGFVINASVIPEKVQIGYERAYTDAQNHPFGSGDSALSVKYNFLPEQALKASVSMIDGDEKNGFGNEYTEYGLTYAHDFSLDKFAVYSSLGYTAYDPGEWYEYDTDEDGEEVNPVVKNNWNIGVGLQYPLMEGLDLCLEATKQVVKGDYLDRLDGYVTGMIGLVWTVNEIPLDLSYTTNADSKDYTYAFGTTLGF